MFATDEPALAVEAIAVGLVARRTESLDPVSAGLKAVQAIARNIAKDEDALFSAPNGPSVKRNPPARFTTGSSSTMRDSLESRMSKWLITVHPLISELCLIGC